MSEPDPHRSAKVRCLIAAIVVMAGVNAWILDRHCRNHGTTVAELPARIWHHGPLTLLMDGLHGGEAPIPTTTLRSTP